jgi:anti-sigma B factor antagonist
MNFRAIPRNANGATVVDLSGPISLGEGSAMLREMLRDLARKGEKRIILNLADVTYIDSTGIGELVSGYTSIKNQGGELKLLNLTRRVHDILLVTRLYTVFDIHSDEKTALSSFQ